MSNEGSESLQESIPSAPWHALFVFLDTLLMGVVQVKSQHMKDSLFEANEVFMWIFVVTIVIYCFALAANMGFHIVRCPVPGLSRNVSLLAGSLSSVCLIAVLLPYYPRLSSVSVILPHYPRLILLILWFVLSLALGRASIRYIYESLYKRTIAAIESLYKRTMAAIDKVISLWTSFRGKDNSKGPPRVSSV